MVKVTPTNWIALLGGIGMFLYGMSLLGSSLEKAAGPKLEQTLERLAGGKLRGVLLGVLVTAVIQSSSATSIMVIGFINSGIMNLNQGVAVMMGSNIGTTVTGQLLRLGDISSSGSWLSFLKPSAFAPLCIAAGAAIRLAFKKETHKNVASMVIGFGLIFVGMSTIETSFAPFAENMPSGLVSVLDNPFAGFFIGVVATAILQSCSASVGVLQAVAATGAIRFQMAAPIVLGMNVGKFIPVLMAASGSNRRARRAVMVNMMICLSGAVVFLVGMYMWQGVVGFSFWDDVVGRGQVANFHTLFNVVVTVCMLPFSGLLVKLSGRLIPGSDASKADQELSLLDKNFLKTPSLALGQSQKVVISMGESARENLAMAMAALRQPSQPLFDKINENEDFLDKAETKLGEYLVHITASGIDREQTQIATEMMHTLGDFERIGDYAVNVSDVASYNRDHKITFSDVGWNEIAQLFEAAEEIMDITIRAFAENSQEWAESVEPLEETIDSMVAELKQRHIDRLQRGECDISRDISYTEVLTNVERISDHCSNIAVNVIRRATHNQSFDPHVELNKLHQEGSKRYDELFKAYMARYMTKL